MSVDEWRFVLAHEFLHVALTHRERRGRRDHHLFNVACDFVINSRLAEMDVGVMPAGLLLDREREGFSVEEVYDRTTDDLRRYRKLQTLRGRDRVDILEPNEGGSPEQSEATGLDSFYRRVLAQGPAYHEQQNRGFLPAGLVEESEHSPNADSVGRGACHLVPGHVSANDFPEGGPILILTD
jgi:hypothetical protein